MWLGVLEPSGSGCRCAENLWRYRRHMKSKTRLRVFKWLSGEIATGSLSCTGPSLLLQRRFDVMEGSWSRLCQDRSGKWAALLLSEGRSVRVQRERRVKTNTPAGFWWDGTITFSPQFHRRLTIPQTRWPLRRYGSRLNSNFTQREEGKKTPLFSPFTWCVLYFLHVDSDGCGAVLQDGSALPARNVANRKVWNCQITSVVKQPCPSLSLKHCYPYRDHLNQ